MSDPNNPAARVRPSTVTISSYLLILFAVLQVIGLILALSVIGETTDVMRDLYAGTDAEGAETFTAVAGIGAGVIGLIFAIGLIVLAVLNNKGKNGSRITTWVLGGVAVCCSGAGLAIGSLGNSMGGQTTGNVPSQEEVNRALENVGPSWLTPVSNTLSVIGILALLVALILLALPASNAFFRKQPQGAEPPVPGAAYPGYPQSGAGYPQGGAGYPQGGPGYPPAGQSGPGQQSADPGYPAPPGSSDPGYPQQPGGQTPPEDRPGQDPPRA